MCDANMYQMQIRCLIGQLPENLHLCWYSTNRLCMYFQKKTPNKSLNWVSFDFSLSVKQQKIFYDVTLSWKHLCCSWSNDERFFIYIIHCELFYIFKLKYAPKLVEMCCKRLFVRDSFWATLTLLTNHRFVPTPDYHQGWELWLWTTLTCKQNRQQKRFLKKNNKIKTKIVQFRWRIYVNCCCIHQMKKAEGEHQFRIVPTWLAELVAIHHVY